MKAQSAIVVVVALGSWACSFDLSRLRGPDGSVGNEGGIDATGDTADSGTTDENQDTASDVTDAADAVDPNACTMRTPIDPTTPGIGVRIGPSLIVQGTTVGAPSLIDPPTVAPDCPFDYSTGPAPELAYRYVVNTGSWLQVTTDAPMCATGFDTVVYMRTACDPAAGMGIVCDDDDGTFVGCGTLGMRTSTALASSLTPGEVLYVFVDGYMGNAGAFRAAFTENGLPIVSPPAGSATLHCGCPSGTSTMPIAVGFPSSTDTLRGTGGMLANPGDSLSGSHTLGGAVHAGGFGMEFQLQANTLAAGCTQVIDATLAGTVVQSFALSASTPVGVTLRVAMLLFADVVVGGGAPTSIGLTVRSVSTLGCGGVTVQTSPAGTVTVLGGP